MVALALVTLWTVLTVWGVRHALAVNRLASGVGDVTFYGADGRPWFRLDERRRDVSLVADRAVPPAGVCWRPKIGASTGTRGSIRSAWPARCSSTRATARCARAPPRSPSNWRGRCFSRTVARWAARRRKPCWRCMLEVRLSKAQILELYLNRVYLSAGLYGVEAMSTGAFGKHARDLSLAESALIAGLVQAPSALSPWSNLDGARRRSSIVLARMVAAGDITPAQAAAARAARLTIRPYPSPLVSRHGYAKEFLQQQFRDRFGGDQPPDWEVHTTLQPGAAGRRRAVGGRGTRAARHRRAAGRAGGAGSRDGQRAGGRRREGLPAVAVQSGHPQPPAAGFGVQAVCLCGGARAGAVAGQRVDRAGEHGAAWQRRNGRRATSRRASRTA